VVGVGLGDGLGEGAGLGSVTPLPDDSAPPQAERLTVIVVRAAKATFFNFDFIAL
jgi:hypothetical protein